MILCVTITQVTKHNGSVTQEKNIEDSGISNIIYSKSILAL